MYRRYIGSAVKRRAKASPSTTPGATASTRIPSRPNSKAHVRASEEIAAFVAEYAPWPADPCREQLDRSTRVESPASASNGAALRAALKVPVRLRSTSSRHASGSCRCQPVGVRRSRGAERFRPAVTTQADTPPSSRSLSKAESICLASVTSPNRHSTPLHPTSAARRTKRPPTSSSRDRTTTCQPSRARRRLVAAPIPRLPPTTTARRAACLSGMARITSSAAWPRSTSRNRQTGPGPGPRPGDGHCVETPKDSTGSWRSRCWPGAGSW